MGGVGADFGGISGRAACFVDGLSWCFSAVIEEREAGEERWWG